MRYKKTDRKNAEDIIQAAYKEMKFTQTLPVDEDSASTIARSMNASGCWGRVYFWFRAMSPQIILNQ